MGGGSGETGSGGGRKNLRGYTGKVLRQNAGGRLKGVGVKSEGVK